MPTPIVKIKDMETNKLKINNSKVIKRIFEVTNNVNLKKEDVKDLVKQLQNKYNGRNLVYMVCVNTPQGFRSGRQFKDMEDAKYPDTYDWDNTNCFVVYAWKKPIINVGNNKNNDCLFNSISSIVNNFRLPKDIKTPEEFKKKLGLKRNDKVPISLFSKAEDLLKVNINCGSNFISKNKYKMTANLELEGLDHIKPKKHNDRSDKLISSISFKNQKLVLCEEREDDVLCYEGGINTYTITYKEYRKLKHDIFGEKVYINDPPLDKSNVYNSLTEKYDWFINQANLLKELTNGKIDLSKSGYKITNEALKCVYYSLLPFEEPEPITEQEQLWIYNAFMGGLIFSEHVELNTAYCYDRNSAYPNKLIDQHFQFPIKQGEFTHFDFLPDIIQFGIYRAEIEECDDKDINKLFRFNENNHYTHYDLTLARQLNLKIKLIQDREANALLYVNNRAYGSQYFKQVITSLYEIKYKCKLAKIILNTIWGVLCSRYKIERITYDPINLKDDDFIVEITPLPNGLEKVKYLKSGKFFKFDYARLGVFLTSACRKDIASTILPFRQNVYRCHTDSILSNINLEGLNISNDLGDWKLENKGKCNIYNSNNVEWNI